MSHKLIGNSVAEVELGNRDRALKRKVQLDSAMATKLSIFLQNEELSTWQPDIPLVNTWYFLNSKHNKLK